MFESVEGSVRFPALEAEIGRFWREQGIYEKSLEPGPAARRFVFYEGPPTANGLPHPGHCLTRAIKDLFPRYRTMRGYLLRAQGRLGHARPAGRGRSLQGAGHPLQGGDRKVTASSRSSTSAIESVFRYTQQWEQLTERLGFWVNLDEAYVTYHQSYVESVWWALKNLFDRGLLYQGHKIVWWWAQGGTALSSGEVGQGYREVADPERVRAVSAGRRSARPCSSTALLVWTTTPWTLPSNQFAAVNPDLEYSLVEEGRTGERLIMPRPWWRRSRPRRPASSESLETMSRPRTGRAALRPPFDYYYKSLGERSGTLPWAAQQHLAWRVVAAEFVTIDSGTGIVHQAPAFGEVDLRRAASRALRFLPRRRAGVDLRRRAGRQVHGRSARLPGPLGQGVPTRTSLANCGTAGCSITRSSTCTSIRSAGGPKRIR